MPVARGYGGAGGRHGAVVLKSAKDSHRAPVKPCNSARWEDVTTTEGGFDDRDPAVLPPCPVTSQRASSGRWRWGSPRGWCGRRGVREVARPVALACSVA